MSEPTPRPWRILKRDETGVAGMMLPIDDGHGHCIAWLVNRDPLLGSDEANATHIVKCVNMHDELVEELKNAWACIEHLSDSVPSSLVYSVKQTMNEIS